MRCVPFIALLFALPGAALAEDHCQFSAPRSLDLQLAGASTVVFEVGPHDLHLQGRAGGPASLRGRACASSADLLDRLTLTQQRVGDKLVVRLQRASRLDVSWGNRYAYLDVRGLVPDTVRVQLDIGSGDAWADGVASLSADVGSGDVEVRNVKGPVTAKVGSGDLDLQDIGALHVLAVGSGNAKLRRVHGPVQIGSLGSGAVDLAGVDGAVEIGSVGSGDLELADVKGGVTVGSLGSGDLTASRVGGDLQVGRKGSGSIRHRDIGGRVLLPRKD